MTWNFRNRITLSQKNLASDQTSVPLAENVTLRALRGSQTFTGADWLLLEGEGYSSSDAAYKEGKLWRHHLSVAFANVGVAADFDPPPPPNRNPDDRPESPEAPGLIIFPRPSGLAIRVEAWAEGSVSRPLDLFLSQDLPQAREAIPKGLSRRLELAYTTFHRAMEVTNPELKYILYVTSIEALIDEEAKPQSILDALALLQAYVSDEAADLAPEVKKRLCEILEDDKKESITQSGAELASQLSGHYKGKTPSAFFKRVYNGRSKIVHGVAGYTGKNKRFTAREVAETIPELHRFVLDLLTAEIGNVKDTTD